MVNDFRQIDMKYDFKDIARWRRNARLIGVGVGCVVAFVVWLIQEW